MLCYNSTENLFLSSSIKLGHGLLVQCPSALHIIGSIVGLMRLPRCFACTVNISSTVYDLCDLQWAIGAYGIAQDVLLRLTLTVYTLSSFLRVTFARHGFDCNVR